MNLNDENYEKMIVLVQLHNNKQQHNCY